MKIIVIGRDPQEASLLVCSNYVSGYHAELFMLDNGDMYLVDKSTNGTTLNGVRLTPGKEYAVHRGDVVMFADAPLDWSRVPEVRIPRDVKRIVGIGSHYMNDIKVQGVNVSRFHATVRQMKDGKWFICDHSKNGTTVNGQRIPKDSFVRLSAKDEIACAGVRIANPVTGGLNRRLIVGISAGAATVAVLVACLFLFINRGRVYSGPDIYSMYDNAVVLMLCDYHFEVSCGSLELSDLPDPDSWSKNQHRFTKSLYSRFVIEGDYIVPFDGDNGIFYTATGFFIGRGGHIATNRHVAKPWEADKLSTSSNVTMLDLAEEFYKAKLTKLYELGYTVALPYISQVKVTGKLDNVMIVPNGEYLDEKNSMNCSEEPVACGANLNEDIAIFRIRTKMPDNMKYVPIDRITKNEPSALTHIVTFGFPYGISLMKDLKNKEISANVVEGAVSGGGDDYSFRFDATSYNGASGSPIFDDHANLVGVVNAKMREQGFGFAIKSEYLEKLIKNAGITE